ncbi:MAG TPA: c-type cytochrome [Albitalea sp.]|nr:c-type cytochrome [Albitalea sp.]
MSLLASLALSACVREAPVDARFRTVAQADAGRGPRLMAQYQCGSCHVVPGAPAAATAIAVPLTRFGQRSYIAGRLPNGPATLPLWLLDPPAQVPGTAMPRLGLSPQDARDIAAYLLSAE